MIPGSGRSAGEEIGYPHQYSWSSLVAQLVKNPPAMRETWVRSLGWEDPLEKGQYSGLENSMDSIVHRVTKSRTRLSDSQGTRVHVLQLRVCMLQVKTPHATQQRPKSPRAATETRHRQIND